MSDLEKAPAPSPEAQPSPAQALKELAATIERGDELDFVDVRGILGGFRAAGLSKQVQQMVIEVREDAKAGRMPEALTLRMIAMAMERDIREVQRGRGRPPGSKNKPKVTKEPWEIEAEASIERQNRGNESRGQPHLMAATSEVLEKQDDEGDEPVEEIDEDNEALIDALARNAPPVDIDKGFAKLEDIKNDVVRDLNPAEREALAQFRTLEAKIPELNEGMNRAAGKLHGREAVPVVIEEGTPLAIEAPVLRATGKKNGKTLIEVLAPAPIEEDYEPEDAIADVDLVTMAAEILEQLGSKHHGALIAELYDLALRLEKNPIPDLSKKPLHERVAAELSRRLERAIEKGGELPPWTFDWLRMRE
jgi:hypothetical protein